MMNDNGAKTEAEIALAMREVAGALQHTVQSRSESIDQISPYIWYISSAADEIPKYWSEARDRSLREFWHTEPILAGAVASMVSKIKTLGWTIEGPRRQVSRYQPLLAEAEFGAGWGTMISKFTEDILTTDKGGFLEVIRTGARLEDPIVGLAHLDSQRCWLSGDPEFPVVYLSQSSGYHKMAAHQVLHLSSMPSPDESMRDIGFCATSRVLRAAQILRDVEVYKREKLSSRPNRGMWIVQGTTQKRMDEAIASAMEKMDNDGLLRFAKPIVVAMMDTSQPLNVEQLDFASLPDGYDEQTTITLYVYMVALAMGVDAREFWPATASGATKADAEVQAMKARGKGTGDLLSMIERALNWNILPKSLTFHFDFQDDEEDRARAELEGVRIENVVKLYAPAAGVEGLVSRLEARRLLADANVLPEEFVANEPDVTPDVTADDIEQPKTEEEMPPAAAAPAPVEGEAPLPADLTEKELKRLFGPRVRYRWPEDTYMEVLDRLPFGMKHLRGRHDQSSHGHRRSTPGAGRTSPGKPSEHPAGSGGGVPSAKPRELGSDQEAKAFLADHYGGWRKGMTAKEDAALAFYQSPGYELMNGQLRGRTVAAPAKDLTRARDASKQLAGAIDKAPPLKQPLTVYRGFSADQFGKLTPGQVLQDKAFVSTALTREQAGSFVPRGSQALATIRLPEGTKAAAGTVKELVLPPGSRFRLGNVTKRGKVTEVELELLP